LNWGGLGISLSSNRAQEFGGKIQIGKCGHLRTAYPTKGYEVR